MINQSPALFDSTNIIHIRPSVQDYRVPYNNIVLPIICEGWHFTHMWKILALPHHFTKKGGLDL